MKAQKQYVKFVQNYELRKRNDVIEAALVSLINKFELISHIYLVFLLLLWTSTYRLGFYIKIFIAIDMSHQGPFW